VLPLAENLRADQLRRLGDRLLQTIEADANSFGFGRLLTEARPRHAERWSSPRVFIAREESAVEIWVLKTLCEALAAILPKMRKEDASEVAGRLALRFNQQGWARPMPHEESFAAALRYAPEKSLRYILKTPFAVGGLRQTALRSLELADVRDGFPSNGRNR